MVLVGSGREADVYALDEGRVLRRYRDGGDTTAEAKIMGYVAGRGFPVPRVYESRGADLVMERLDGPTMAAAAMAGRLSVTDAAVILAGLHRRLHDLPALDAADPGDRLLHLDLHPENVMLTGRGPVVIDWRNATEGPPDLDVALSGLILAQAATDPAHPAAGPAGVMLTEFLRQAGGDPMSVLDRTVAFRRWQLGATSPEAAQLPAATAYLCQRWVAASGACTSSNTVPVSPSSPCTDGPPTTG